MSSLITKVNYDCTMQQQPITTVHHRPTMNSPNRMKSSTIEQFQPNMRSSINKLNNGNYLTGDQRVDCFVITKDSQFIITANRTSKPRKWSLEGGTESTMLDGAECGCTDIQLACDDTLIIAQTMGDTASVVKSSTAHRERTLLLKKSIKAWDIHSGCQKLPPEPIFCTSMKVVNDNKQVLILQAHPPSSPRITTQFEMTIFYWCLTTNKIMCKRMIDTSKASIPASFAILDTCEQFLVFGSTFGERSTFYVVQKFQGPIEEPSLTSTLLLNGSLDVTSRMNCAVVCDCLLYTGTFNGQLFVWCLSSMSILRSLHDNTIKLGAKLAAHRGIIHNLSLSPDSSLLLTCSSDKFAILWNRDTEKVVYKLDHASSEVMSGVFSPDQLSIATCTSDSSIYIWSADSGKLLHQMKFQRMNFKSLYFSPDSNTIVAVNKSSGHRNIFILNKPMTMTRLSREMN